MKRARTLRRLPALFVLLAAPAAAQSIHDETGLTALIHRLGAGNQPTGAGVVMGQVEVNTGPGYAPNTADAEFAGKSFVLRSGNSGASGHATIVGRHFYGIFTSLSPGVGEIECFEVADWMGFSFLNGSGPTPPLATSVKVFNNSWIGGAATAQKMLRKLDYAIDVQQVIVCNGVNNGAGPLDVPLLSHSFNAIAVGRSDGNHRSGDTGLGIEGPGRQKPELVAPAGATSYSTPLVGSAAALLVETARSDPALAANPAAERADLIKAVLMAGAKHRPGWSNGAPTQGPLRGSTTQPLDGVFGADQIHVDRSHWILTGGEVEGAASIAALAEALHAAWDEVDIGPGESRYWLFRVASAVPYASVLATWNRDVAPDFTGYTMPDLDLELWALDAQGGLAGLVGDPGIPYFTWGNVQSASPDDNVEHLYLADLQPGDYVLELRRSADPLPPWRVALAWELACPEPAGYGTGKTTSLGTVPHLSTRGVPSHARGIFELEVSDGVPDKNGIAFYGFGRANSPFLGGTLLVQPPVRRTSVTTLDANGAGTIPVAITAAMVGTTRNYQFWFRDPAHPDGTASGLTDAVEVTFCH